MKAIEQISIRFRENNEEEFKAWSNLQSMDTDKYGSKKDLMVKAINELCERDKRRKGDPYLENREREEDFMQRITDGVLKKVTEELPFVLSGYLINYFAKHSLEQGNVYNDGRQGEEIAKGLVDEMEKANLLDERAFEKNEKLMDMNFIF